MSFARRSVLPLFGALVAACSAGQELTARDAWIRLSPPGSNAAAFLTLENHGTTLRRVTTAESADGFAVELHETVERDGVARMGKLDGLEIPGGQSVTLKPRGIHLMLLRPPTFREGQMVRLWLTLDDGTRLPVEAQVRRKAPAR